jgi:hypothetical protein
MNSGAEADEEIFTFDIPDGTPSPWRAPAAITGTTAAGHSSAQRINPGSLAILTAIRLASSLVSSLAADRD